MTDRGAGNHRPAVPGSRLLVERGGAVVILKMELASW
jgi:hypothetical protein